MSRTSLAVVLLLLAFGLSAPALVGPMLVDTPAHQNVSPETPQRISFAPRVVAEEGVPRFGRDVAVTSSGALPQLDGAELGRALGTPAVPQAFTSSAIGGGGGIAWESGSGGGNGRRRSSESRIFTGGGAMGGAAAGLLGWGLRDARGSAAATAVAPASSNRSRSTSSGNSGSSNGGSPRGSSEQSGNVDDDDDSDNETIGGEAAAGANAINTVEPQVTNGKGGVPGVLGSAPGASGAPGGNMPAATPEPATLLLVGSGAAIAGFYRVRRRSR